MPVVFFIGSSEAELNGRPVGDPVRVDANPTIRTFRCHPGRLSYSDKHTND
jgi:hypothetical protein